MKALKNKHLNFIAKKVLIFYIILSIISIAFVEQKWLLFGGLTVGSIFSLLRFSSLASALAALILPEAESRGSVLSVLKYILNQLATILLLIASIKYNIWFFAGVTTGILLAPFIIFVNGITEGVGITHNNFE